MTQQVIVLKDGHTITGKLVDHMPHGCAEVERGGQRWQGEKFEHYLARVNRGR